MFIYLIVSAIIVIAWAAVAHYLLPGKITLQEALIKGGIASVLSLIILAVLWGRSTADTNITNGYVTDKKRVEVSCSHSYQCNCYQSCSGSGTSRTCTTHCSTCYSHSSDFDWRVYTNIGELEIDRINSRGDDEPPRWTKVALNEPASITYGYTNYVLAAPSSLFAMKETERDAVRYGSLMPEYPKVYDYYRVNRVLTMGTYYPEKDKLNKALNEDLRWIGKKKQVNVIVLLVNTPDADYRYALERKWLGAKKNDVVVILGVTQYPLVEWVDVITFGKNSGNELMTVKLKDRIKAMKTIDNYNLLSQVIGGTIRTDFHRKEMKDYEYLKGTYQPSPGAVMWYGIFMFALMTGMTIFFYYYEFDSARSGSTSIYQLRRRSNRY